MSMSAFLHTMLEKRRPIPLMEVMANMIFCLPSTLVFSRRRMCWKSSPATSDYNKRNIQPRVNSDQLAAKEAEERVAEAYHGGGVRWCRGTRRSRIRQRRRRVVWVSPLVGVAAVLEAAI
jgi:hypothetical protein